MSQPLANSDEIEESETDWVHLFMTVINAVRKRIIAFVFFLISGIVGGCIVFYVRPPVYSSSMIIKSEILTSREMSALFQTLEDLIENKNLNTLGQKLKMEPEALKNIKELTIDKSDGREAILTLRVQVYDKNIVRDFQTGIVTYLENNEYNSTKVKNKKDALNKLLNQINEQINDLEKLKSSSANLSLNNYAQEDSLIKINPYLSLMALFQKQSSIEQQIQFSKHAEIVEGFSLPEKPISNRVIYYMLSGITIALFLFYLFVRIITHHNKK